MFFYPKRNFFNNGDAFEQHQTLKRLKPLNILTFRCIFSF